MVESRLAARLAGALSERSHLLPDGVETRLRFAREQAVARSLQVTPAVGNMGVMAGGVLLLGRFVPWWPRVGALLPVMVLAFGSLLVADMKQREDISVAVEIDAALLADDLPPEAYADPGFVAFLKLQQP
jgi:Protein of unknown function (DUF3619)